MLTFQSPYEAERAFIEALSRIAEQTDRPGDVHGWSVLKEVLWTLEGGYDPLFLKLRHWEVGGSVYLRLTCGPEPAYVGKGKWTYYHKDALSRRDRGSAALKLDRRHSIHRSLDELAAAVVADVNRYLDGSYTDPSFPHHPDHPAA